MRSVLVGSALAFLAGCGLSEYASVEPSPPAAISERPKVGLLCLGVEETLFSCKVEDGNSLSVCAAGNAVSYRYGPGSPEVSIKGTRWATVPYSGGGEAQILFTNGDTNTIVFSRMVRTNFTAGEPNNPAISDGVIVMRGDKVLSMQKCEGGQAEKPVDYNLADAKLMRENELFTYETGRKD